MKEVKTQKKYKCDFCNIRGIKRKIEFHEFNCFRNPNRVCSNCKNVGWTMEDAGDEYSTMIKVDCLYCAKFDQKKLDEINSYFKDKLTNNK